MQQDVYTKTYEKNLGLCLQTWLGVYKMCLSSFCYLMALATEDSFCAIRSQIKRIHHGISRAKEMPAGQDTPPHSVTCSPP